MTELKILNAILFDLRYIIIAISVLVGLCSSIVVILIRNKS
jgi:multisubunit Na+/H+ antiporter MnhB subunit